MSRDELSVMDGNKCILQLRGVRPFLSDKFDITKHKRYRELSDYDEKNAFDVEAYMKHAALDWLEIKKREISYETCSQYRNALFRLEHYLLFGDIKSSFCRSEDSFFCRSGISESFFRLTYELKEYYATTQNPCYYHTYSVAIKEFFRLATSLGVTEPEAITIDTLIEYWNTYCKSCKSLARRQNAVCAMTALMKYLHRRGDVPECYQRVLFGENVEILLEMRLEECLAPVKSNRVSDFPLIPVFLYKRVVLPLALNPFVQFIQHDIGKQR